MRYFLLLLLLLFSTKFTISQECNFPEDEKCDCVEEHGVCTLCCRAENGACIPDAFRPHPLGLPCNTGSISKGVCDENLQCQKSEKKEEGILPALRRMPIGAFVGVVIGIGLVALIIGIVVGWFLMNLIKRKDLKRIKEARDGDDSSSEDDDSSEESTESTDSSSS